MKKRLGFSVMATLTQSLLALGTLTFATAASAGEVVVYPAPKDEQLSTDYVVTAGGKEVDVYRARTLDPPFAGKRWDYGGPYSFANFDMAGEVTVKITSKRSLRDTIVRPASAGIVLTIEDDHTLTLRLDRPRKLSIEPDGKKGPLLLFANPVEENPPKPDGGGRCLFRTRCPQAGQDRNR